MEYKNNMLKLPVYIPNYNISNNQETEKKTDKKYKYTYVNIDSSYRQTEDVYEYSQYYYLDCNPFVLNENKTEIKLKLKQEYTNDFKNYDKITIEHIQSIIMADFFNNLITIQNHKAIFNDLPEQLKFTNSDLNYLCTIQFDNVELQNNNENINLLFNLKKIYFLNDRYYLKISNKDLNIFNSYNFSNVKVKIMFFYTYNIDYNTLEASNKTNINFHTITKEKDYLIIKLNKEHNFIVDENNEEFYFGGQNVMIRKINNITLGYQNTNYYKYELKEQINNIVGINIINSSFPCYINNITSNKNKLYFKTYNNKIIYDIQLENGYYDADLLQKIIKDKINNITLLDNKTFDCEIVINEKIDLFSMKLFMCKTFNFLEIKHVYFIYDDAKDNVINYKECLSFDDIKSCELLKGYFIVCISSFSEYDDELNNYYISVETDNKYINCLLFNTVIYLPNEYFKNLKICNDIYEHHSNTVEEYLTDCLCFYFDILKDYENLLLLNKEIKIIDKLNLNFTIKVPIKFMLLLNYKDTFCSLFGFQNIGLDTSITEEHYEITNKTKYFNQDTLLTKHININPYNYIYCLCDQIHSNNIRTNVKFDLEDVNASVFSIFQIYKQKKDSNNIFNSFVNTVNISNKIDYIKELIFYFYKPNGELVDFNGLNHSFLLEFKHY